ncbi:MAG: DciA family protein [Nitrospinae bacterium]|jgi:predicted nucleic acid-binding Zn ribbon protein|nr:DciA family protein [Nitrospinota bacterium]MDA1109566.1 DciA family protein [Nitrospinota bacterium]
MSQQRPWSGIRSILSHSLKQVVVDPRDSLELMALRWALVAGKEIAEVTQVNKVTPKTLYIDVAGNEWLSALQALQEKIIAEMREQEGCGELTRILFKVVSASPSKTRTQAAIKDNAEKEIKK